MCTHNNTNIYKHIQPIFKYLHVYIYLKYEHGDKDDGNDDDDDDDIIRTIIIIILIIIRK